MVHRDLKLENILLSTADSSDNFNIKVFLDTYVTQCHSYKAVSDT